LGTARGTSARINRNVSHDLAVIAVRVLDDAKMTWVAAEVESEHVLARDLHRLSELTQPYRERLGHSR
jgi:hypothetical protein